MGKYYVAGIPFDSENSLKHYGVKGMEWNKHKFGIDADDRYIKWLKNAGQNIGRFANNAAQNVAKGATAAAKTVGTAVNKGANFVTGNQDRQNAAAKRSEARTYNQRAANPVRSMGYASDTKTARPSQWFDKDAGLTGRDYSQQIADQQRVYASKAAKANQEANEYEKRANNAVIPTVNRAANAVGNQAGQAAQNAGDWAKGAAQKVADVALWPATREDVENAAKNVGNAVGQAAQNVGNAVGHFFSNRDEYQRLDDLSKHYDPNTGKWDSEENRKAFYDAQDAYNRHPATAIPDMARQIGSNVKNFVDYNITGEGQRRMADMLMQNPDQVNKTFENDGSGWKQTSQYTNAEAAERELSDAKNNTLFGRVGNAANTVGNAAQNVGNVVSGAANKATEGAKGFLNSAGQWVSGAANNVKNTASKAASDAKKGASGFLNSAGQWVSNAAGNVKNAAQNVGNTVGQAAQNVGNTVGQAAQNVGNTVGQAAQNVGNTVGQAAEQARGGIGGFFDRVGNAVGGAAQNVGNAVGGAANAAGNWIGDRARDVGGAVTGAAQNVGNAVGGAVNAAGNWIGDRARDVGGAVTGAANQTGQWIGDRVSDADYALWRAKNGISDFVTGGGYDKIADSNQRMGDITNKNLGTGYAENVMGSRIDTGYYDQHPEELQRDMNFVDAGMREAGKYYDDAAEARRKYGQTLPGIVNNAGNAVSNAAGNVADWARNTAGNVGNVVSGAAGNAVDWARNAAGNVGNAVSGAAGNVADWARNTAGNVGDFVDYNVTGDYYNQQAKAWQDALNSSPANADMVLAPNGMMTPRYNAERQLQNYSQDANNTLFGRIGQAAQNIGGVVNKGLEPIRETAYQLGIGNQAPSSAWYGNPANMPFYQRFFRHSALDEKPDGVSDAFWEKFTADGGTREEYERDWR